LLADEINRAPAKTQSALLEAMEERQVNLDGERHPLGSPSWSLPPKTRSSTKAPTRCPKRSWIASCSKVWCPTPLEVEIEVLRRYHLGFDAHDLAAHRAASRC
jgi:MoxR-like ATPase